MTDEAFGHWLAGFVDGEGTFSLIRTNKDTYAVSFAIKLRADDAAILRDIQRYRGCGRVFFGVKDGSAPKSPYARYATGSIRDIVARIVPLLEQFPLRAKKRRDFEIWSEAARLIYRIGNRKLRSLGYRCGTAPKWTHGDRAILEELRLALIAGRGYDNAMYEDHLDNKVSQLRMVS